MKRTLALILAGVMAAGMLVACGKKECDSCGNKIEGKAYKVEIEGEKATVCETCKGLVDFANALSNLS